MKKSLFSKLLKTYVIVTLLSIVVVSFFFYLFFKSYYFGVKEQQMIAQGEKMAGSISPYIMNQDFTRSNEIIHYYNKINSSQMWIVNKDGKLINGLEGQKNFNHLHPRTNQLERALKGEVVANQGTVKYVEGPVLTVAVPIYAGSQVAGAVFVCNPLSEITDSIIQTLQIVMFAGIISIVIVAVVSFFISQSITKPIKEITKSSLEMINGNFTKQAKVHSSDEIGILAGTFNKMMRTLDTSLRDLEHEKNKMAAMERMQREFVANASHELRTPLTSVRGYLEALLDGMVTSEEQENRYLRITLKETLRLQRLVNGLLDLSKMESGQMKFHKKELHLSEMIDRIVINLESLAEDRALSLRSAVPEYVPAVLGDEDLIEQVLINYITNAIRFTPEGGEITVKVVIHEDEVHVHVIDTGVGIPPGELPQVWKRFYKINSVSPSSKEGAGLGLSLVKEIMDRLDGKVWAESTPNQGSIFSFSLKRISLLEL
ncbi:HAMP domain-containing protein [Neobacillus sp. MM2021_6]|uniref:HAMP domain-containing sensor histidine kinase n=1 Tax=Bacillaceae TaxID=186817 RepID=UPI00140E515E|nr:MULTISPECIES: ATP-binding protein [Bacillaceae]MBO0959704.1 HAMP domain-containing protein [Neobacillus sp. MM2021_6]NHC20456.1 cell wall metabolism sensor histidine kinase WalK [Bacillus sp. MM2020_4]